jgi:hypothetical protein
MLEPPKNKAERKRSFKAEASSLGNKDEDKGCGRLR